MQDLLWWCWFHEQSHRGEGVLPSMWHTIFWQQSQRTLNHLLHASHINTNKPQWKHQYQSPVGIKFVQSRRILLDNFNILASDCEARRIFPKPLMLWYQHKRNLDDILEPSTVALWSLRPVHCPANSLKCHACKHITFFCKGHYTYAH